MAVGGSMLPDADQRPYRQQNAALSSQIER